MLLVAWVYVKSDLKANKRDDLSFTNNDFETIWIEIDNSKAKNILCCCAYRHPSSDISKFSDYFQETFSKLENENKLIFVIGDFNINLLNHENHTPTNEFINMMFSNNLQPSVIHPTPISDTCSTLIDNIFVNSAPDSKIHSGNVLSLISDHLPQFCIIYDCKFDYKASSYVSLITVNLMPISSLLIMQKLILPSLLIKTSIWMEGLITFC